MQRKKKKNIFPYYLVYPLSLSNNQKNVVAKFFICNVIPTTKIISLSWLKTEVVLRIELTIFIGYLVMTHVMSFVVYELKGLKGIPDRSLFHIFIQSIRICVHKSPKINFVDNLKRRKSASEIMNFLLR
mgnify:CR=1 FL=1